MSKKEKGEPMDPKEIVRLMDSGQWMIRFSNDGVAHGGFRWAPVGEWTVAPDWRATPECGCGLRGQSPLAAGHCQPGTRMELCETSVQVSIGGDKVKCQKAKIIAVNSDIPLIFITTLLANGGSLYLRGYAHALPEGFTSVGGSLYLEGYAHADALKKRLGRS